MVEVNELTRELDESDYARAQDGAIEGLLSFLRVGDALGKSQAEMMGSFMGAFQAAATQVAGE